MENIKGCACGCGSPTNTDKKGQKRRYLRGHHRRGTGKGWIEGGYHYVMRNGRKVGVHHIVAQDVIGRSLRSNEVAHHIDYDKLNNVPSNLAVTTRGEHQRLHQQGARRQRWTDAEIERGLDLRRKGMTIQEISVVLGRPFASTAVALRRAEKQQRESSR